MRMICLLTSLALALFGVGQAQDTRQEAHGLGVALQGTGAAGDKFKKKTVKYKKPKAVEGPREDFELFSPQRLTIDDFDQHVFRKKFDAVLIHFKDPESKRCKAFDPVWTQLADHYVHKNMLVAEVNCMNPGDEEICKARKIKEYPNVWYRDRNMTALKRYFGRREIPDMTKYMHDMLGGKHYNNMTAIKNARCDFDSPQHYFCDEDELALIAEVGNEIPEQILHRLQLMKEARVFHNKVAEEALMEIKKQDKKITVPQSVRIRIMHKMIKFNVTNMARRQLDPRHEALFGKVPEIPMR